LVLPFWYRLTQVVPDKGPLNGCVCVCMCHEYKATIIYKSTKKVSAANLLGVPSVLPYYQTSEICLPHRCLFQSSLRYPLKTWQNKFNIREKPKTVNAIRTEVVRYKTYTILPYPWNPAQWQVYILQLVWQSVRHSAASVAFSKLWKLDTELKKTPKVCMHVLYNYIIMYFSYFGTTP